MNLFEKMLRMETRQAFLAYREKRRMPDALSKRMREYLLSSSYETDVRNLMNGIYLISLPEKKLIPKSYSDRKRTVYHFTEDEMSLFRMMAYVLHEYESMIPKQVYSFKHETSAKDLILYISRNTHLRSLYTVKADIVSYGNSIDPDRLIRTLQETLGKEEPSAVAFFSWLLGRKRYIQNGKEMVGDTAALPGCPIHNFFTNLYLVDMDRNLLPRCVDYARYSDDIILFVNTKEEAEANLNLLFQEFASHKLSPHEDEKTGLFAPGEAYDFLGFTFKGNDVDIADTSLRKLKRKMRIRAKRFGLDKNHYFHSPEEKAAALIRRNQKTFYGRPGTGDLCWSRWAFPVITKAEGLHELDLYNQRCIRFLLSGKWSNAQYRIPYSKLKELGYQSLVRSYYDYSAE